MTKKDRLVAYLKKKNHITPREAADLLGDMRVADTVFRLKQDGVRINTKIIKVKNRWGETRPVAEYSLAE